MPTTPTPSGWTLTPQGLTRTYAWKNFVEALAFVVEIAPIAESMNHHPDIDIRWNKVHLVLMTHSEQKVTELDYLLADKINTILDETVQKRSRTIC